MYLHALIAAASLFLVVAGTEETSSTSSQSNVPTGTPIPGKYDGPLRPQVHFSPPEGFMNDPNGMFVDVDGVYHLYYQCTYISLRQDTHGRLELMNTHRQSDSKSSRKSTLGPCDKRRPLYLDQSADSTISRQARRRHFLWKRSSGCQ